MLENITNNNFNTAELLDDLLKGILDQLKPDGTEKKKEVTYLKLIELFIKGMDLREKLINSCKSDVNRPQFNIISGIELDKI